MERIKQALERAREQRQAGVTSPAKPHGVSEKPASIHYTQTQVATVSTVHLHDHRIINPAERDDFVDAYKILRTQVLQRMKENNWVSLAVTSPRYG
jgi:protein-tyrosine kinase